MTLTIAQIRERLKYADALRAAAGSLRFVEQSGRVREAVCICGARADLWQLGDMKHAEDCSAVQLIGQALFIEAEMIGATVTQQ